MSKKSIMWIALLFFVATSVFAHGKNDVEEIEVENLNSWQEKFDLEAKTKKKAVKYNIMVTASDLGGNVHVEGPFNIWVDPKSDLPIAGITNPYPNMRVVGNLNIVGTCVDDDGVSKVILILDEGTENEKTVTAEGTEYWSYFLKTEDLKEGAHTIKVIGYDINSEPVESKPVTLTWQLDRQQPLTDITQLKDKKAAYEAPAMGLLVSGNVTFKGTVADGNQIKELYYSTDNGNFFATAPISKTKNKEVSNFTLPTIDTRKFPDGPSVIWFKAIDYAGSVGLYSFLYYIDNTKPDVEIVYPKDEVENGKFTVAGYAKDAVGLEKLKWTFGTESGELPIVPGNPYWAVTVDTVGAVKEKARKFTISALDIAGNLVDVSKNIQLNQEDDKPVVTISEPTVEKIFNGDSEAVFVRGIVSDDDSVASVEMVLDNGEPVVQQTKGVFYHKFGVAAELSAGNHKITVTGIDENGVRGNPVTVQFVSKGIAPVFGNNKITAGKTELDFFDGMEIHPEANVSYAVTAASQVGIKNIHTKIMWGNNAVIENDIPLKNVPSYNVVLPVTKDWPKGVVTVVVTATDAIDRESDYKSVFYVTNTAVVKNLDPEVRFTDSTVQEDGSVILNAEYPASGYVIGAKIVAAELDPPSEFISKVAVKGNQIKLIPNMSKKGGSAEPSYVVVTTEKGRTIKSKPLYFKNDTEIPVITIDGYSNTKAINAVDSKVTISGKVACQTGIGNVYYNVLGIPAPVDAKGFIGKTGAAVTVAEKVTVKLAEDNTFSFSPDTAYLESGMYIVELIAESAGGNKAAMPVAITTIPEAPNPAKAKAAVVAWLDSVDVYGLSIYQGEQEQDFAAFPRSGMNEGTNPVVFGKGKYSAIKNPTLTAAFASVDEEEYYSGMPVKLAQGPAKTGSLVKVVINTGATVNSVNYEITGDEVSGGDLSQKGVAKLTKPAAGSTEWTAEIPLINLPSRVNQIKATIKAGSLETEIVGSVTVIRDVLTAAIDDEEKIYCFEQAGTVYDKVDSRWVLSNGGKYYYYANLTAPVKAEVVADVEGLKLSPMFEGSKLFVLTAPKDGLYKDVKVIATDRFGDNYESTPVDFLADSEGPSLEIETPVLHDWLGNIVKIQGTAADALGVRSVEYSLDKGETWKAFALGGNAAGLGVTFTEDVNIEAIEDGLVSINIRALDNAGHYAYKYIAGFKDTTPPEVRVIQPTEDDVVNGETLIVFQVKDNGWFNKTEYLYGENRQNIELAPLVNTYIGTKERPIENDMNFIFTDDAGNAATMADWSFAIDNASDLPRAEIHVPEELQVLTRDFTISGVIYDDDGVKLNQETGETIAGPEIWYKIDDGEFKRYPQYGTSFSIDVPISSMTDNEHTVTVYANDINGTKGEEITRTFRISLAEPEGSVVLPEIDTSVRSVVSISGVASDANGIEMVEVSLDNGNSYNKAVGGENWEYIVDSRAIPGGTQVVFLRVTDKYGIKGLYSSLINIDNEAPDIELELPLDDSFTTGRLFYSGHAFDNVEIAKMYVTIRNMDKTSEAIVRNFATDRIIGQTLDITDLPDGFYNIELTGEDRAGNKTNVSRNIHLQKDMPPAIVDVLYPLNGEHKNGKFNIYGQAESNLDSNIVSLKLYIDDEYVKETTLTDSDFYKFEMNPPTEVDTGSFDSEGNAIVQVVSDITPGEHRYRIDAILENGNVVPSREQTITYSEIGPWITLDNFVYGDFALNRPTIRGMAGYCHDPAEVARAKEKTATKDEKNYLAAKSVAKIEVSFDNGKTFEEISTSDKWTYRIENQDLSEGYHFMLIRATMKNGEIAIERTIIQIDNTAPIVKLIGPTSGGRYNQSLDVSGLTKDDVGLENVVLTLRKGDKAAYEVPSFIQGLYLDFHFWGSTLFDIGAGLTFFDDNVKVQFQWGQFTQAQRDSISKTLGRDLEAMRYGGDNVFGMKILANVASLPFSYFFGHDWEWLYANAAIGAQFTRFNETNSGKPQFLSAILAQLEFPRVVIPNMKMFSTMSLYSEFSGWFIPSDVSGDNIKSFIPQGSLGFRVNVF